jgi:hypothetical protein
MANATEDSRVVQQLFVDALRRDPHTREDFLDAKCADRPDIRLAWMPCSRRTPGTPISPAGPR